MTVVEGKYAMRGGVKDTLFGLIGATKGHTEVKSLGGIVDGTIWTQEREGSR
jgi:hypothetical protein